MICMRSIPGPVTTVIEATVPEPEPDIERLDAYFFLGGEIPDDIFAALTSGKHKTKKNPDGTYTHTWEVKR